MKYDIIEGFEDLGSLGRDQIVIQSMLWYFFKLETSPYVFYTCIVQNNSSIQIVEAKIRILN